MENAPYVDLGVHDAPVTLSDHVVPGFTKLLRFCADTFFAKRNGHRAIVLETVAAVPRMVGARTAHRPVGYFEEEPVISYTLYLAEIDAGRSADGPAPAIARHYWKLADDATLRDVVLVVRTDEAPHRDVSHGFASILAGHEVDPAHAASYPEHADDIRRAA